MHARIFSAFVGMVVLCIWVCSCSGKAGDVKYQYVEIAPSKYVPVKFPSYITVDLVIKYDGKVVSFRGPAGINPPETLMEYNGKLYVLAFDASARTLKDKRKRGPWRYRCFEQDGLAFKEIPATNFPRSIATINIWRPNGFQGQRSSRYSSGMNGETIDQLIFARTFDTEDLYFANSEIAWLWFMLEVANDYDTIEGGGGLTDIRYDSQDRSFIRNFKAKYKPVQLTTMELTPVPKEERDF